MLNSSEYPNALPIINNLLSPDNLIGTDIVDLNQISFNKERITAHASSEGSLSLIEEIIKDAVSIAKIQSGCSIRNASSIVFTITTTVSLGDRLDGAYATFDEIVGDDVVVIAGLHSAAPGSSYEVRVEVITVQ